MATQGGSIANAARLIHMSMVEERNELATKKNKKRTVGLGRKSGDTAVSLARFVNSHPGERTYRPTTLMYLKL